jgi:DNA-binding MarR family transcriptional regulator
VIHEPARLMIMTMLYALEEADFLYLQRECGLTQGNLSSHLARLEEAGYVQIRKTFKGKYPLTICSFTGKGRRAFQEYAQKIRIVSETALKSPHRSKIQPAQETASGKKREMAVIKNWVLKGV